MKKILLGIITFFLCCSMAYAQGDYLSISVGSQILADSDFSFQEAGAGTITYDTGEQIAASYGYYLDDDMRVQFDASYRYNKIKNIDFPEYGITYDVEGSLRVMSMLASIYYDFTISPIVTPFIGVGLGLSIVESRISSNMDGLKGSDSDSVLSYHGTLGANFPINESFSLDVEYRYFKTEDPDMFEIFSGEYKSHNLNLALRYYF